MPDIENYQVYNDRMRRSMWDKDYSTILKRYGDGPLIPVDAEDKI